MFAQAHRQLAQLAEEEKVRRFFAVHYLEIWTPEFAQAHRQLARLAEEGKVRHLFCCSLLHGDVDGRVCAGAQAAGPARRGGKGKRLFFLFSTRIFGRQSLRRRTVNWLSSQRRER